MNGKSNRLMNSLPESGLAFHVDIIEKHQFDPACLDKVAVVQQRSLARVSVQQCFVLRIQIFEDEHARTAGRNAEMSSRGFVTGEHDCAIGIPSDVDPPFDADGAECVFFVPEYEPRAVTEVGYLFQKELANSHGRLVIQSGEAAVAGPDQSPRKIRDGVGREVIDWVLDYPAILDTNDMGEAMDPRLAPVLDAYRRGVSADLYDALNDAEPDALRGEPALWAAILLAQGSLQAAENVIIRFEPGGDVSSIQRELLDAIQEVIAAVQNEPREVRDEPRSATGWLARSYTRQARGDLEGALAAAERAVAQGPDFGFGWARLGELQFAFGRRKEPRASLDRALQLSPDHAPAWALFGFVQAAEGDWAGAREAFEDAMDRDGFYPQAWLGRGMIRIRNGDGPRGRLDLQVAAAMEPDRSIFRSYLAKALDLVGEVELAERELALARRWDPLDPTPWLYGVLIHHRNRRIHEAIDELQRSRELNEERRFFRSGQLLDEDAAVRSANLARVYADAGLTEVAVREAATAVAREPGRYEGHLFLADALNARRDARAIDLRFEKAANSELLLANLLAPASTGLFTVGIAAEGLLFQWFRIGVPVAGATGPSLVLENVQPSNAGSYTVEIRNAAGESVVSRRASLDVGVVGAAC